MKNVISAVAAMAGAVLLVFIGCSDQPSNPCDGVQCPAGQVCRDGTCVSTNVDAGTTDAGQDAGEDAGTEDAGTDAG